MPSPADLAEVGRGAAFLWFISSLSFAFMMALIGRPGRRASWSMMALAILFAASFTGAAVLVEARRNAQQADVRYAQDLLDGSWATLLDPGDAGSANCRNPTRLKMSDDRRLSELSSQGFVYLYNAHILKDEAVHALNPDNQTRVVYRSGPTSDTLIKWLSVPREEPVRLVLRRCSS